MEMRKLLLDSGILRQYVSKRSPTFSRLLELVEKGDRLGTCTPVLAEFYYGLEMSQSRERNVQILARSLATLRIWSFESDSAKNYGQIASHLRRIGRPMQSIDIMMAAVSQSVGNCTIITTDSDLESVPGSSVEKWTA